MANVLHSRVAIFVRSCIQNVAGIMVAGPFQFEVAR